MSDDDVEVDLHEGMPIQTEEGDDLGTLAALLIPEEEEEAEFLLLRRASGDYLVPFEAIAGVGDGAIIMDLPADVIERFPRLAPDQEPTEQQVEAAYDLYDSLVEPDDEE